MKTTEQLEAALQAIRAVCREHGVVLIGTCISEGIYGEILIAGATEHEIDWSAPRKRLSNALWREGTGGPFYVDGIGDLP